MIKGQTVIVIDMEGYEPSFSEKIPFKAELCSITYFPCYWVRSFITGREYKLYGHQILENLSSEEIGGMKWN